MKSSNIIIAGVLLVAFAAGIFLGTRGDPDAPDVAGFLWPDPPAIAEFTLDRANGGLFDASELSGRWTLLFFGFTNCPDVCPTTMNTLNQVYERLKTNPAVFEKLQVVFVSVDPQRDRPENLAPYVKYFNESFIAVTADETRLKNFTRQFGVLYMKIKTPGSDNYNMDHSASILMVDPNRDFVGIFSHPHEPDDIAKRIGQIALFIDSDNRGS